MNNEKNIEKKFQHHDKDTGSVEVQIVKMTEEINKLAGHFAKEKKDFSGRRGLERLVSRRRKYLDYVKKKNEALYKKLIQALELRK